MDFSTAIAILSEARSKIKPGYAYDILTLLLDAETESTEDRLADTLFRTIVLDEGVGLREAAEAYYAAAHLIELEQEDATE